MQRYFSSGLGRLQQAFGVGLGLLILMLSGCADNDLPLVPSEVDTTNAVSLSYRIGPLDQLRVIVWRSEDLSLETPVRPDGRISMPLIGEIEAGGKTVDELSADITEKLRNFIQNPVVSVVVANFGAIGEQTINVLGEVGRPSSVPYRNGMTVLDVMVAVGGMTEFAAGNDARLIRGTGENQQIYGLRLENLLNGGDMEANVPVVPGDVIMIPKSFL